MLQQILNAIDWNAVASALITFILSLLHRGSSIKKLNKAFGPEAVQAALKADKSKSV